MKTPTEALSCAVAAGNLSGISHALMSTGHPDQVPLEARLRIMVLAIHRDNPKALALLDQAGWLDGYAGDLHPLAVAAGRRKTQAVRYLLDQGRYANHDLVTALAGSVDKARPGQVDRRRESIHRLLLDRLQRQPSARSPWHRLLAAFLGGEGGWLGAAHEGVTPHLFEPEQHDAFLALWPRERQEPDLRASRWLLEEGLNPSLASQRAPFWQRLAEPFLARELEAQLMLATAHASGEGSARGRL